MKIKNIVFCICIIASRTFSQDIYINFKKECLEENSYGLIKGKTPYLIIEIKNLTGKDVYFKNPFLSIKNELPEFTSSMVHSTFIEDKQIIKKHLIDSNKGEKLFVEIGSSTNFYDGLEVQNEEVYKSKDTIYEVSYINDKLSFIYRSLRLQKILDKKGINQKLSLFSHKTKEHISLNEVKNKLSFTEFYGVSKELVLKDKNNINIKSNKDVFCFLKKGESIDFKVNLIGFKLLGGVYHLSLAFDKFENFIEYRNKKITLPSNYNNYHLYQGKIKFNNLKVSF